MTNKVSLSKVYKECIQLNIKKQRLNFKVHRRPEQTFFQRRYTDGQSVEFSCSVVSDSLRPHRLLAARQASLSITNSQSLFKLMSNSTHKKTCSILLIIRKMKIKTTMRYHLTPFKMAIIKKTTNNKYW